MRAIASIAPYASEMSESELVKYLIYGADYEPLQAQGMLENVILRPRRIRTRTSIKNWSSATRIQFFPEGLPSLDGMLRTIFVVWGS